MNANRRWLQGMGVVALALFAGCIGSVSDERSSAGKVQDETAVIGSTLGPFSLPSPDGRMVTWDPAAGQLSWGTEIIPVTSLVVHAFQPDCNSCEEQARAMNALQREVGERGVVIVAVAHRGTESEVSTFAGELGLSFPVVVAEGSSWALEWGRGDPMYVTDRSGTIVYSQAGFQATDPPIWRVVLDDVVAGMAPSFHHPQRVGEKLADGDRLPPIELPDLMTGKPMALTRDSQGMHFLDVDGDRKRCRATIGFFSRY